jgi:hypothetical protein
MGNSIPQDVGDMDLDLRAFLGHIRAAVCTGPALPVERLEVDDMKVCPGVDRVKHIPVVGETERLDFRHMHVLDR